MRTLFYVTEQNISSDRFDRINLSFDKCGALAALYPFYVRYKIPTIISDTCYHPQRCVYIENFAQEAVFASIRLEQSIFLTFIISIGKQYDYLYILTLGSTILR